MHRFRNLMYMSVCATIVPLILPAPTTAASQADDGDVVALVDGRPIARVELVDILIDAHGVDVLQQLIILRVAKQEARRRNLRVTDADAQVEFREALDRIAEKAGMTPSEATDENKHEALRQVLEERGISMCEFMIGMERNACLRKIAEKDITISEETLREQFARMYGERVVVRHIQIAQRDMRGLNHALDLLSRGADFADAARRLSKNDQTAARGGEMDPFTFDDANIPAALREAAFSLKAGGVSNPVLAGQFYHILKLERRIPADNVRFEDKREEVERSILEAAVPQAMGELALELFRGAKIKILDDKLRGKYNEFLERGTRESAIGE